MNLVIEAVSKTKEGLMSGGTWYNADKKSKPDFSTLTPGTTIEADLNGKWVKSFKVVGEVAPVKERKAFGGSFGAPNPEKDAQIARSTAAKAVFSSSLFSGTADFSENYKNAKDTMLDLEAYILTGKFPSTEA